VNAFSWQELQSFATRVLVAIGINEPDASDMAEQIIYSEFAGHESHGLRRLSEYVKRAEEGGVNTSAKNLVELDLGSIVKIDADGGFGHIAMRDATSTLVERAKAHGIAAVALRNSEWVGRFVDFCQTAADDGVATIMFVNSGGGAKAAAPTGATEPRLSTNPIAAGIPREKNAHLILDMATTAVALGRVSEMRDRGELIPEEWVNQWGVLQFAGGAKGFGLALVAEALAGALTGAGTVSEDAVEGRQGVFMIGINVEALKPLADFTAEVEKFADYIKSAPLESGAEPIRLPGESSIATSRMRAITGVTLTPITLEKMQKLAEKYSVELGS